MAKGRPILSEYGPESNHGPMGGNRATCGGECKPKDLPYSPPTGPKGQMHNSVGLGGINHGPCGTQGKH